MDEDRYRSRKRYSNENELDEGEKRSRYDRSYANHDRGYGYRDDREREPYRRPEEGGFYRRDEPRGGGRRAVHVPRTSPPPPGTKRLTERPRPNSQFDKVAKGFEDTDAISAKATGFFGAPVNSSVAAITAPGMDEPAPPSALKSSRLDPASASAVYNAKRHQRLRRLYVENVSKDMSNTSLRDFFNETMTEKRIAASLGTEPCMRTDVHPDENYAMAEFRHPDDATNAMLLDGIEFQRCKLSIQRPRDYSGDDTSYATLKSLRTTVPDSPNKLYVGSIPAFLDADQVMELLKAFGEVRHFDLLLDDAGHSRGIAFCEFLDDTMTELALAGLTGLLVGEQRLVVKRAVPEKEEEEGIQETSDAPTNAMTMLNMVTPEELQDDEEYKEILEDVREECVRYGTITDIRIPRPASTLQSDASRSWKARTDANPHSDRKERRGVGRVYVQFATVEQCSAAFQAIAGRQFGGRMVICAYIRDEAWPAGEDGTAPESQALA